MNAVSSARALLCVALFLPGASHTYAGLSVYEPFKYSSAAGLDGLNGGLGWSAAWQEPGVSSDPNDTIAETIQSSSLTHPSGAAALVRSGNHLLARGLFSSDYRLATPT